ncbi:MAG: M48 family metallopeptidase [Bacteroidales bacterium]|nr:M48 family metallopeptidase [Bacteroidales bacterium]
MVNTLYFFIIAILVFNLLFSIILEQINLAVRSIKLPDLISDVYDSDNYLKQQEYEREKVRFSQIETIFGSILIIFFFSLKGFGHLQLFVSNYSNSIIVQTLLFFGILGLVSFLISIPFSYYDNFVIEEKFGFNKSSKKLFFIDNIKTLLLSTIIGGILIGFLTWLYTKNPHLFWLMALGVVLIFSLLMNALYSSIILPLFNKKTPLKEGDLKHKVLSFAESQGFSINNIYLLDGSKRSSKANAFFTGFGKKKKIFLYDTLTNSLNNEEIVAVLAHELGHYKRHHIWVNLIIGIIQSSIFLYFFNLISQSAIFTQVMGGTTNTPVFYLNIICFVLLINPVETILGILLNLISRKMEYSADSFANKYGLGQDLGTALKKISSLNYSNLTPHSLYVIINYSHPPLYERLKALNFTNELQKSI